MARIITITGTPGTGKTEVAKILAQKLRFELISINDLIENKELRYTIDKTRNTKVVDIKELQNIISRKFRKGSLIVEGHYSHFLRSDITIVLRCNPVELAKRLKKKGWNHAKIKENIEAELIGIVSAEAFRNKRAIEIDTTGKNPKEVAAEIIKKMKKNVTSRIDWLTPKIFSKLKKVLE